MAICKFYDFKYINYACMPFVKACLGHEKLHAMCHKWRLIYMVTRIHTQLKEDEDLSVCDSSEPNLNNFWGKWRQKPQRTMLRHCYQIQKKYTIFNIQCISMLQQRYKTVWKSSQPLFRNIIEKERCFINFRHTLKNLEI